METFRLAHVATCFAYLAVLVVQFARAGWSVLGGDINAQVAVGGSFLFFLIGVAFVVTAWLGGLGLRTFVLSLVVLGMLVVPGLPPALAFVTAGITYFGLLAPALDAAPAPLATSTARRG